MRYTKLIIFAILTLNFVVSTAEEDKENVYKMAPIDRLQEKIRGFKGTDEVPREALLKSLKLNPALRTLIEKTELSGPKEPAEKVLRTEVLKHLAKKVKGFTEANNDKGDIQYITGIEFHDAHCREYGPRVVKYVGCTMAEFGTWETVKFSGPKNSNVTFYVYDRPNCNGQGHGVRSFIKDTCMYDRETKKYAIWTW